MEDKKIKKGGSGPHFDLSKRAKPVLKWAGGKSQTLSQLIPRFPKEFNRYIEPFMGGGATFFSLKLNYPALLSDSNSELIELYEVVRDAPEELAKELDQMKENYSEEYYYSLREKKPTTPLSRTARTIFLNKTGYNGLYRQNSDGKFNVPYGKRPKCPSLYEKKNLHAVSARLQNAKIQCQDFADAMEEAEAGDFIYCDPPYEPISATSSFKSYVAEGFSQEEQGRLHARCLAAVKKGAKVAVSNSSSPYIQKLYEGEKFFSIRATRAINSKGSKRGPIQESLILLGY